MFDGLPFPEGYLDRSQLTSRGSNPGLPEGLFRAQAAPKELRFWCFVVGICASKMVISWDIIGISRGYHVDILGVCVYIYILYIYIMYTYIHLYITNS
jgi:hypothetical protein